MYDGAPYCSSGARGRPAAREARRLPQLARHPQPRGRRRRALPREDRRGAGRARRPGHHLLRRPRRGPARRDRRRRSASCAAAPRCRVYLEGMLALRRGDLGRRRTSSSTCRTGCRSSPALVTRKPVVVLVHHVHREQWPVVYPGLTGRVGWWIERRLAPRLYRRCQYVAVSRATRGELRRPRRRRGPRIAVVHNGTDPVVPVDGGKARAPRWSRGRPAGPAQAGRARHRRRRSRCATTHPDLRLHVVGGGWWEDELHEYAAGRAAPATRWSSRATSTRRASTRSTSRRGCWRCPRSRRGGAWWSARPACTGTPTVAYRAAGGTRESVVDGRLRGARRRTGPGSPTALGDLLDDHEERARLGEGAQEMSHAFTWGHAQESFAPVVRGRARGAARGRAGPRALTDPSKGVVERLISGGQPGVRLSCWTRSRTAGAFTLAGESAGAAVCDASRPYIDPAAIPPPTTMAANVRQNVPIRGPLPESGAQPTRRGIASATRQSLGVATGCGPAPRSGQEAPDGGQQRQRKRRQEGQPGGRHREPPTGLDVSDVDLVEERSPAGRDRRGATRPRSRAAGHRVRSGR